MLQKKWHRISERGRTYRLEGSDEESMEKLPSEPGFKWGGAGYAFAVGKNLYIEKSFLQIFHKY